MKGAKSEVKPSKVAVFLFSQTGRATYVTCQLNWGSPTYSFVALVAIHALVLIPLFNAGDLAGNALGLLTAPETNFYHTRTVPDM